MTAKNHNYFRILKHIFAISAVVVVLLLLIQNNRMQYNCIDINEISQKALLKIDEQKLNKNDRLIKYQSFIQDLNHTVQVKSKGKMVVDRLACLLHCKDITNDVLIYYGLEDSTRNINELPALKSLKVLEKLSESKK